MSETQTAEQPPIEKVGGGPDWFKGINNGGKASHRTVGKSAVPSYDKLDTVQTGNLQPEQIAETKVETVPAEAVAAQGQPQSSATETKPEVQPVQEQLTPEVPAQQAQAESRKVIALTDEDALIELPGEKPKTLRQLNFERKQGKDVDRMTTQLSQRERELQLKEQQFEERLKALEAKGVQATVQHTPVVEDQEPQLPKGAMEGDPEYTIWQSKLNAFFTKKAITEANAPLLQLTQAQLAERDAEAQRQREVTETWNHNDQVVGAALRSLPFEFEGLSKETQDAVFAKIAAVGVQTKGINLADKQQMQQIRLNPDQLEVIVLRAFPEGSLPPGHSREETQPVHAADALTKLASGPLVPKAPPQPPLQATTGSTSAPPVNNGSRAAQMQQTKQKSWYDQMGNAQ